jgi:methyl-accepting chemotaxis protein
MIQSDENLEASQQKVYYDQVHKQADSIARSFIVGFFLLGVGLSFFYETYWLALFMGGSSVAIYFLTRTIAPGTLVLRLITSFLFWNFGLQFLFQMQGLYEVHFTFFISLTVLLFYEDWKVMLPATIYALASILFLFSEQDSEFVKSHFSNMQEVSSIAFLLHLLAITFYAALCIRWSVLQHSQTRESALRAIAMKSQLGVMDTNISFADSISQGNLAVEYGALHADRLGESLKNMRQNLLTAASREERERFATIGLARIGEILRQNADNLETLSDKVIEEIVRYMKANQGSVFVVDDQDKDQLQLIASRAWERKKFMQKTINIGDGLVGQAAIERRTIFMTKVPDSYISITSGLGEANPRSILIVPLQSEDQLVGVVELASFKVYEEFEIKFLERVGESIASTILTTKNNQRNKDLLEKSNALMEQLRSQEEEIRQNMEEMQATQEEMGRKEKEINRLLEESQQNEQVLREKIIEINKIEEETKLKTTQMLAELEQSKKVMSQVIEQLPEKIFLKDEKGRMLLLNSAIAAGYNKPVEELLGKSDFDLFPKELAAEYWKVEEEIITSGKQLTLYEDFPSANGEIRNLYTVKMPFRFPDSDKVGILGYQVDITDIKRMENKVREAEGAILQKEKETVSYMQNYQKTLLNILDQLPHKIFLKDKDGKMVLVNTVVAKAHNMSSEELIGKSDFDFVDAATAQDWRNQELEIIRKGSETYIFDEKLGGKTITLKSTKMAFDIPHLHQTGLLGIQTDITELQQLKEAAKK